MGTGTAVNTGDTITAAKMNLKLESVVNADVEAGAAIAGSKLQELSLGVNAGVIPSTGIVNAHVAAGAAITEAKLSLNNATHANTWAALDKTTSSIADITTKSHTALTDIGTNTHAQVDTHIADTTTAHGAVSTNTASKIVIRDVSGNFAAGTITASLTGNASGSSGSCTGNAATVTGFTPASGSLTLAGADAITLNTSATTNLTLPTAGTLIPSNPTGGNKKVTNIYYDPTDGQIKYEVEP